MVFRGFTRQLHGETLPHTGETFLHINRRPRTRSIVVKHGCIVHTGARTRCGDLETMHSSAAIDFSMGRRIEWTVFSPRKINFFFIQVFLPLRRVYFAYFIRGSLPFTEIGDRSEKFFSLRKLFFFNYYLLEGEISRARNIALNTGRHGNEPTHARKILSYFLAWLRPRKFHAQDPSAAATMLLAFAVGVSPAICSNFFLHPPFHALFYISRVETLNQLLRYMFIIYFESIVFLNLSFLR